MNLKLRTLLLIAILLVSGNACLAQTQTPSPPGKDSMILVPDRHKCLDLLELERLEVDQQTGIITHKDSDRQLAADYMAITGWLQGFFTAVNVIDQPDGDVTKRTKPHQWITWTLLSSAPV